MNFFEFLSPLKRHPLGFFVAFAIISAGIWSMSNLLPNNEKITLYFTVVPRQGEATHLDAVESSTKIAETISGWAKNPRFRADILEEAGVYVPDFKKRITARKQNRMNVFWTLKIPQDMASHSQRLTQATLSIINKNIETFNQENAFPIKITPPQNFSEPNKIPWLWSFVASVFAGLLLASCWVYLLESMRRKVSFQTQVKAIFPTSPLLQISEKLGKHDQKLLERFIATFMTPHLIGTFSEASDFFTLKPPSGFDTETETPILLVKLGNSSLRELENLKAIFGEEVGIIIFEA